MLWDPVTGTPNVTCQMADPSCASTPRTMSAIDGSTSTSRVPSAVFTFGRMSGCASMPRASPTTGMIVARVMPLVATDACVSCLSRGFQPLLELSAERVNQGSMVVCAGGLGDAKKKRDDQHKKMARLHLSTPKESWDMLTFGSHPSSDHMPGACRRLTNRTTLADGSACLAPQYD